ncbi:diacylglycerol/lipid kinase family protein [Catalinimonas niigatensis]|uniref:diacylglycerol/lipid kinase family protein n=1 Tax=Catalinimonas niigatensis TaxID=1397264 RepID=UPI0026656F89|nr:YegS/Rv2252/BmrU family lipid kinase [Catalinimonas niigatensis]WPP51494.1 YegS/Rv2252/BmrU family lipid kinase [Catalinimonas niigatensis]
MQKKQCLFIINPISGLGKQKVIPDLIRRFLDPNKFSYEITFSEYAGHTPVLTAKYRETFDIIVAVGGDGTVNEVATALVDTSTSMGVIPLGSGNGFARHLEISTQASKAILQFNESRSVQFDTGILNNKAFFNVSGVGFDGQISKIFAEQLKRGYMTYARCVMEEFQTYVPKKFRYELNGHMVEENYFLIAFANTTQYGNNAIIAPYAKPNDGLLDVVLIRPFPSIHLPVFTMMALFRNLHRSPYVQIIKTSSFSLDNEEKAPIHIDGEFLNYARQIEISVKPGSLHVMAPVK